MPTIRLFAKKLGFVRISAIGTNERYGAFGLLAQAEAELLFCDWRHSGALTATGIIVGKCRNECFPVMPASSAREGAARLGVSVVIAHQNVGLVFFHPRAFLCFINPALLAMDSPATMFTAVQPTSLKPDDFWDRVPGALLSDIMIRVQASKGGLTTLIGVIHQFNQRPILPKPLAELRFWDFSAVSILANRALRASTLGSSD
jgi:hypothetical protein